MEIKKEFELLRGESIGSWHGDPMAIPCAETSDPERICKNPTVSVHMLAFNHESYIRQAIEGVMEQKTDFEIELVIGEDCSTDNTRKICFEYQKKYPEKIRVLWCGHNLHTNPHPAGRNEQRNLAHCRGEFIAFCEGDDYWIDPFKLQKQVNAFRQHVSAGVCLTGFKTLDQSALAYKASANRKEMQRGLISGRDYLTWNVFGRDGRGTLGAESVAATASIMCRKSDLCKYRQCRSIASWRLRLSDVPFLLGLASVSDVIYLKDCTTVYRVTSSGACSTQGAALWKDNLLVRFYYLRTVFQKPYRYMPWERRADFAFTLLKDMRQRRQKGLPLSDLKDYFAALGNCELGDVFSGFHLFPIVFCLKHQKVSKGWYSLCWIFAYGMNIRYIADVVRRHSR